MEIQPLRAGGELSAIIDRYQSQVYGLALAKTGLPNRRGGRVSGGLSGLFPVREGLPGGGAPQGLAAAHHPQPVPAGDPVLLAKKDCPSHRRCGHAHSIPGAGRTRVWQALAQLEETYRLPIYLFYFQELSTREIARVLSIRPGAVRMRLSRGREQLRVLLKGDYFDE